MLWSVSFVGFLIAASSGALISDQEADAITEVFHNCKCMYSHQCGEVSNAVNQDFSGFIQPRIHTSTSRIPCRGSVPYQRVCCKVNPNASSQTMTPTIPNAMTCGFTTSSMLSGAGASDDDLPPSDGDFPWMAAIFVKTSGDYKFRCGGSLIHPKVVLTAAHCVYKGDPSSFRVVVNGKIKLSEVEASPEEKRQVSRIIRHPKYDNASLVNDAALLILEEAFGPRDENPMNILCLPSVDVNLEGARCLVAGWGKEELETVRERMKKVKLPFVSHDRCQSLLRKTALGRFFVLDKSFLCAGGEAGKDACGGDGGGPLMCSTSPEDNQYFQAGIVAFGVGCGYRNIPGVYTNVAEVLDWIKGELKNRNLDV